jgi:hypothetical protein
MTPSSLLPKIAKAAGVSFEVLCEQLLEGAELENVEIQALTEVEPTSTVDRHAS